MRVRKALFCLIPLSLLTVLGCSGSNIAETTLPTATPTPDGKRFSPNYANNFTSRRRWPLMSFKIFVDKGEDTRSLAAVQKLVSDAATLWQTGSGSRVTFAYVTSAANANFTVRFVNQIKDNGVAVGAKVIGLTTVSYSFSGSQTATTATITGASIQIKTGLTDAVVLKDLTHELGHAMGIEGHSDQSTDVMFAFAEPPTNITLRDLNTLGFLYATTWRGQSVPGDVHYGTATIACGPD